MLSLTLQIEKFCWTTSQVINRGGTRRISLAFGAFSGACSVFHSIDIHNLHGALVFQMIGRYVFFYLVHLLTDALYIMLEIGNIELPGCFVWNA
ncbi:uncharacterized protein RHIMIDRAFT_60489 [Rhizopus microsporus ATCC 52813]|uniref:Uncharacterized protein n=1 Tax=Rhizopus microsporus ATCC 52813 TaxID=1340429 RepID=A0A2G4T5Q6_RHIZD|nr:uncharacterized protein RHIMIDRAFT_60489 [Rhizopus microsporus ATCC 52813]PHZ16337.1 hypothetical protein RHIMIDRAFT_60489 [Rhizopus microsporus ATCC 52813]